MLEKNMNLLCNGTTLASKIYIPESIKEETKGAYKFEFGLDKAMMFMYQAEAMKIYDMMWMKYPIGFIALNKDKVIVDVGVMKPWRSIKFVKCMYFIELPPDRITGIKKGDRVDWT